ncbi:zinc finger protein 541 isoform X2 [Nymphalis io]|uniref:zinc finger protein 541 isoform X2 n=1 Tax=Inachis io TaxID=171585 RepID=UPI00216A20AF|nr:zinc finger protein 541 isoform X2 [Nymphalis io]
MTAVNSVATTRLPLPTFSPRAVLMYSAAVGGEGVALQLREATPAEIDERLAIACHEPELLADLLHAAANIDGEHDGLTALLGASSPDLALASDASDSLPLPDHDNDCTTSSSSSLSGITTVSVAVTGLDARPLSKKVRPKPASPNRQGPQQCQVCNKVFGNASALAKHKLTHSDERKYVCITCAKAFKRQDHLNGHMLTHRNKKPYECKADGCGKSYCDARSLRRHTENHHQPPAESKTTNHSDTHAIVERDTTTSRVTSPTSPSRTNSSNSDSSNCSEKGIHIGDSSPPRTPPAPPTPPARPKTSKTNNSRPKSNTTTQQSSPKCGSGVIGSGSTNITGVAGGPPRATDIKPVECNLCHRKFKNIPALNGHMRLHGGYFKKDSDSKKLDKKESTGPPLQTASVSVRALIEEKIISRRGANVTTPQCSSDMTTSRSGFIAPAPPPLSSIKNSTSSTIVGSSMQFVSPRAPPVGTVTSNISANQRDSTLIELLKKGSSKVVKRSSSDPGQGSPQQEFTFRPELFGVSFNSDDGYFSPALNEDTFQFATTSDQLEELASLEDYATVAASIRERSPVTFPSSRRLAAVLNSPLPESLADFGACHGGSPVPSPGIGYTENSPGLSYTTGDSPGLAYTATSPSGSYSTQPESSPGLAYPTPPASHDAHSPAHTVPRASSPLTAAFFTATMSSQEEVEEALEEVLPEECRSLDAYVLEPSTTARRIMLNSEDPLLSSSPRDFLNQRAIRRQHRIGAPITAPLHQWHDNTTLQVCVEGRDPLPAVFLSPSSVPASPQRRKRRASPAGPYRSRMRRSVDHYTPQPILPPDRDGCGLFMELINGIQADANLLSHLEDHRLPRINIGVDHQADIPELCNDRIDLHRVPEQLLWDPGINDGLDDNEVRMFMELAMCAAMPVGGHTREYALQTLGECGGDIRAATLRLMSRPAAPSQHESRWTPDEVEAFLAGLSQYDKDFFRISQLIRTKDSKQCIQFYYFWKKVTKDYKTLYLRSWNDGQIPQGTLGQVSAPGSALCASPPTAYDGEEFPCKICGKVFNKVKSRSAHMKSHRPLDAEPKRPKLEKPYEKVEKSDDKSLTTGEYQKLAH